MQAILSAKEDIRKTLIGCLLLFGFEAFHGSENLAIWHARGGYEMLQAWIRKRNRRSREAVVQSPEPNTVEDDIISAFYQLDLQMTTVPGQRLIEVNAAGKFEEDDEVEQMPETFADKEEAYRYGAQILRRGLRLYYHIYASLHSTKNNSFQMPPKSLRATIAASQTWPKSPPSWRRKMNAGYERIPKTYRQPSSPVPDVPLFMKAHARYASQNLRWQSAIERFNSRRWAVPDIATMLVLVKVIKFSLDTLLNASSSEDLLDDVREILGLARGSCGSASKPSNGVQKAFNVGFGVVGALNNVYNISTNRAVRREALEILRLLPKREGIWDGVLTAAVGTWLMDLEEEDLGDGYVPEDVVVNIEKAEVDVKTRMARIECSKRIGDDGEVTIKKTTIFFG
jgi:hypothetical protein